MTPQESRERFEKFIELLGYKHAIKDEVMFEVDAYTHSLITHAMQQIEAGKAGKYPWQSLLFNGCPECGLEVNREFVDKTCQEIANTGRDEALTILQSLLPEQKKGK
jgi:hypothetical protein